MQALAGHQTAQAIYLPARPGGGERLFAMLHPPAAGRPVRGAVLFVHPFADEMNKARRMAARQARALAQQGWWVLAPDLSGCGDSDGEFEHAHWQGWVDDVAHAAQWLRVSQRLTDALPLWLWGLRLGALLAAEAARVHALRCEGLLVWHGVASGKLALQQFLRLVSASRITSGAAAGRARDAAAPVAPASPRQLLAQGLPVDVAGYRLAPQLALGLEAASLTSPAGLQRLVWLELSTQASAAQSAAAQTLPAQTLPAQSPPHLSPATQAVLQRFAAAGAAVQAAVVQGPSFWQTTEIEDAPLLLQATASALSEPGWQAWASAA